MLLITIPLGKESLRQLHTDGRWACEGSESGRCPPCAHCSPACPGSSCPLTTPGAHCALRGSQRTLPSLVNSHLPASCRGSFSSWQECSGTVTGCRRLAIAPCSALLSSQRKVTGSVWIRRVWQLYSVTSSCVLAKVINFCTTITFSYRPFYFFHL